MQYLPSYSRIGVDDDVVIHPILVCCHSKYVQMEK